MPPALLKVGNNANQSTLPAPSPPSPPSRAPTDTPSHFPFRERKMHAAHSSGNSWGAFTWTSFLCRISSFLVASLEFPPTLARSLALPCRLLRVGARKIILPLCCLLRSRPRRAGQRGQRRRRQPTSMRHQTDPMIRHRRLSGSPASLRYTSAQAAAQISPERTSNT